MATVVNDISKTYDGFRKNTNSSLVMANVPIDALVVIPATSWVDMAYNENQDTCWKQVHNKKPPRKNNHDD